MKRTGLVAVVLLVIGSLIPSIRDAGAQRRYYDAPRGLYSQQLLRRVAVLERRVDRLERLLPDTAPGLASITVESAQRQVANAADRLTYSKELFRKGYISQVQLEAEQFEYSRAQKVFQFAKAVRDEAETQAIEAEIAILDAEHDLNVAQRQLKVAERMTASGLMQASVIDGHRRTVEAAQQRLNEATGKAE